VRRRVPYDVQNLKSDEEVEQCTIYVENVPTHVDHEWLQKIFQEFGPIAYIAMPKFKHNGLPKGFAFIEFKEKEGAEHCLNAYGDIGACLPKDLNPEELLSVRTFEGPETSRSPIGVSDASTSPAALSAKRELGEDAVDGDAEVPRKRRKVEAEETEPDSTALEDKCDNGESNNNHSSAEKKKRRRVYKTKKLDNIEKLESDSIQLKILPKKIWRQLRNRYLNLQRENLGKLKKQLRNQNRHRNFRSVAEDTATFPEEKPAKPKNVIAKIEFDEPYENSDALRNRLLTDVIPKENSAVLLFVDFDHPNKHAYVRLDGNPDYFEEVGEFLRNASNTFKSAAVLNDAQTQEFWNEVRLKIKTDPKKKVRGRDKLLQQAMKTATHIRFSDGE
jgi:La-related protein 7